MSDASNPVVPRLGRIMLPGAFVECVPHEVDGELITVHDGGQSRTDDELAEVELYVAPYMGPATDLRLIERMPRLRVVQTLTAGVDGFWPFVPDHVALHNAVGVHDSSTAELAIGLLIARLRRIDEFARAMPAGEWLAGPTLALADRRVMVVGWGPIGRAIAARLEPFEVDIVRVSRTARPAHEPPVHGFDELPSLLPTVDAVILIVPQTEATVGMVDAAFLAAMRDGAVLVNVARGPIVDTDALLAELHAGRLHAALDVTDPEPLPPGHPLWRAPHVLISPHVGGNSAAFLPRARRLVAAQLARWAGGEPLVNEVARPSRS